MANLIIFTGPPASGKSSVSTECSRILGIPIHSKDGYKVQLFEEIGFTNHSEKKRLSLKAERMLMETIRQYMERGLNLIVDNNFKDFYEVRKIKSELQEKCNVICFNLSATYETLAYRYNERIRTKNREVSLYALNQYPVIEGIIEFHKLLDAKQVENIQRNVTEETYGDVVFDVCTEDIDVQFNEIVDMCVRNIRENLL